MGLISLCLLLSLNGEFRMEAVNEGGKALLMGEQPLEVHPGCYQLLVGNE